MEETRFNSRKNFVYDAVVKGADTDFWSMDSAAGLTADTVRNALKLGDTGAAPVSANSYAQFLEGDFEFDMVFDSTKPDTGDSEIYFGLRNISDTLNRGAAYFDMSYDTTAGDSSTDTSSFAAVAYDERGNRKRQFITWDTNWSGGARTTRFRIQWDDVGLIYTVNDCVVATFTGEGDGDTFQGVNQTIPQHIRISKRSADTLDTAPSAMKTLIIRNARTISGRLD